MKVMQLLKVFIEDILRIKMKFMNKNIILDMKSNSDSDGDNDLVDRDEPDKERIESIIVNKIIVLFLIFDIIFSF